MSDIEAFVLMIAQLRCMASRINFYSYIAISIIQISDIVNSNSRYRYLN